MAPDPVTKYRASVPPGLAALVMRCLEKRPADRWQTIDELIPQLEAALAPSGGSTPTAPAPFAAHGRRPESRIGLAGGGGCGPGGRWRAAVPFPHFGSRVAPDLGGGAAVLGSEPRARPGLFQRRPGRGADDHAGPDPGPPGGGAVVGVSVPRRGRRARGGPAARRRRGARGIGTAERQIGSG